MSSIAFQVVTVFLVAAAVIDWNSDKVLADDIGTNFFLKTSKSVPRIGRRGMTDFDDYFMKAAKSVPRIGRRREIDPKAEISEKPGFEKRFFTEHGPVVWGNVEHEPKEFPETMQGDEPYRDYVHYPDTFWLQMKKNSKFESQQ